MRKVFDERFKDVPDVKVGNPEIIEKPPPVIDLPEQFEVLSIIGEGGMGTVYKCRNKYTDRLVAIKVMHGTFDPVAEKRFQQEARAACALTHEKAVTVYDFGVTPSGMPYLVMECLDGQSLSSMIEEHSILPEKLVAQIFVDVCSALEAAHQSGIIHRDIKPSNLVILTKPDRSISVKVLDFGIAKILKDDKSQGVTKTGEVFGSPLYMSPEQCAGNNTDLRSDIYSAGASMYECLVGTPPHVGTNAMQTIFKRATEDAPSFHETRPDLRISPVLEAIVMKAIARDPASRYQNISVLKKELQDYLGSPLQSSAMKGKLFANTGDANKNDANKHSSGAQASGLLNRKTLLIITIACIVALVAGYSYTYNLGRKSLGQAVPTSESQIESGAAAAEKIDKLKQAGMASIHARDYATAILKFNEALAYAKQNKITDVDTLLFIHDKLAFAYFSQNDADDEQAELKSAIALAKDTDHLADLSTRLGHSYLFSNKVADSILVLNRALHYARAEGSRVRSAVTLNELSYAYLISTKYQDCINSCTQELDDLHSLPDSSKAFEGTAYERRGGVYLKLHDYKRAISDAKEAIKVMTPLDPKLAGSTIQNARAIIAEARSAVATSAKASGASPSRKEK